MRFAHDVINRFSLRLRLTLWYVFLLAVTLLIFSGYIYWRFQASLINQVDVSLQAIATQALANVDIEGENGIPGFQNRDEVARMLGQQGETEIVVQLMSPQGEVWGGLGYYQALPKAIPTAGGYISLSDGEHVWRVYNVPLLSPDDRVIGWLQTAQSLDAVSRALEGLREQFYWAVPLVLLLAGFGGFFLAHRALRPIDQITRTAYSISATDLSQRIHYTGPRDEVGRLAETFDAMLDRLQASFERERRFTDDAAHELRTPLTILKGRIGVTLSRNRTREEYKDTLRDLEQEVDRLIRLSTDLLFLSRLDQGRLLWHWDKVDLSDLLRVVAEQVRPVAKEKNIRLVESIEPAIQIEGDQDQLIRLFLNLLDNAVKYTPPGGEVRIRAQRQNREAAISVSDTGPGIPADAIPHIFERFFRVDAHRSRETGGAGLGLAIAYEIVRQHGGHIDVQSKVGEGTTFVVLLPMEES